MIRRYCSWMIFGYWLCQAVVCTAQITRAQTLQASLDTISTDIGRVNAYNELAWLLRKTDTLAARQFATQGRDLAKHISYLKGQSDALNRLGNLAEFKGNYFKALDHYERARTIDSLRSDTYGLARGHHQLSSVYRKMGRLTEAINHVEHSVRWLRQVPERKGALAIVLSSAGTVYKLSGAYQKAIGFYLNSLDIRRALSDSLGIANSTMNIGTLYQGIGNLENAIAYMSESLQLYEKHGIEDDIIRATINLANCYFDMDDFKNGIRLYNTLDIENTLVEHDLLAIYHSNRGIMSETHRQYKTAEMHYRQSFKLHQSTGNTLGMAKAHFNLGNVLYRRNQPSHALTQYVRAKALLDTTEISNPVLSIELYQRLSECHALLNQPIKALIHSVLADRLKDSLYQQFKASILYKMQFDDIKRQNELLEQRHEIERIQSDRKLILIVSITVLLLASGLLLFFNYRARQKRMLEQKNAEIARQRVDQLIGEQELTSTYARLEGQSQERERIGRELHDNVGNTLAAIKLCIGRNQGSSLQANLQEAGELIDVVYDEIRAVSRNLQSGTLMRFGLEAQLRELAFLFEKNGRVTILVTTHGLDERLDNVIEENLYRIIQELIANTMKHANADQIEIALTRHNGVLNLIVEDNGSGFDLEHARASGGLGIHNVESRIHYLHGDFRIDSSPGNGTTVIINVPLNQQTI